MNLLATWLEEHDVSQDVFADKIGVTQGYISRLVNGERIPGGAIAIAIEKETGGDVPAASWYPQPRRAVVGGARRT